jgi:hypothetical protein
MLGSGRTRNPHRSRVRDSHARIFSVYVKVWMVYETQEKLLKKMLDLTRCSATSRLALMMGELASAVPIINTSSVLFYLLSANLFLN